MKCNCGTGLPYQPEFWKELTINDKWGGEPIIHTIFATRCPTCGMLCAKLLTQLAQNGPAEEALTPKDIRQAHQIWPPIFQKDTRKEIDLTGVPGSRSKGLPEGPQGSSGARVVRIRKRTR